MSPSDSRALAIPALISALMAAAVFLAQGSTGFNIADEGFLWYGAQRVILGEVPIRDFMAYDPGRYYWSAGIMQFLDSNGIIALRISIAVAQCLGLFIALFMLARTWRYKTRANVFLLFLAAGVFLLWMLPRHKLFDITVSIALVGVFAWLVEAPSLRRYLLAGVAVGVAAIFGRNHGLYGVTGGLGIIVYTTSMRAGGITFRPALLWWLSGILAGYLPVLAAFVLVPGFASAFRESVAFLFEYGNTNIPLPVPWPWRIAFGTLPLASTAYEVLVGIFFISVPVFGIVGLILVIRGRISGRLLNPLLTASAFMTLPYAHHAFSRADTYHLAQGLFPALIGVLALPAARSAKTMVTVATVLLLASATVTLPLHPGWKASRQGDWTSLAVGQDTLRVSPATEGVLTLLASLIGKYAADGSSFVVTPFLPGAYALFERRSPMWEIYALFPKSTAMQEAEIQSIRNADPGFVAVFDLPLDGRDDLRFSNTHPAINDYFRNNYDPVMPELEAGSLYIYRRAEAGR